MSALLVPTKGSQHKCTEPSIEVFDGCRTKKENKSTFNANTSRNFKGKSVPRHKSKDVSMSKARFEIIKFGSSGFTTAKKQESKIVMAVSLGAKKPKGVAINYKELLKSRKSEAEETEKLEQLFSVGKSRGKCIVLSKRNQLMKQNFKKKQKKSEGLLNIYGKIQKEEMDKIGQKHSNKRKKQK